MKITADIKGLHEALANLNGIDEKLEKDLTATLRLQGEAIMADSKANYVPVVDSHLMNSGHVETTVAPRSVSVAMIYGGPAAPYARAVHENPNAGAKGYQRAAAAGATHKQLMRRSKKGQWKYLETPFGNALPRVGKAVAKVLKKIK